MKLDRSVTARMQKGIAALFIALLIFGKDFPLAFWDNLFLAGLLLFVLGGGALLLEKSVFNRFFASCQKFLKNTSKIEAYAAEMEERHPSHRTAVKKPVAPFLLGGGLLLLVPATLFSLIMF